ncbi:hypothetical protein HFU84_03700 [Acidithiobacillus sp. CV18-2]|nr:hypothetical protein [Acidithiobacillus sp. CV18-3]MBU2758554.1 hypothetical protein [Acidithiobacillus sp. BN09-2]MBU2776619.1 hypothetical protein [Acidithiobacillus sp. CV18-2]MBU2800096.1 hypothetical protein [Acidithiobacillus sp. VAN18-4]
MDANDIKFIESEANNVRTIGHALHSKLPPKTANSLIVETLEKEIDISKPRSTYVNILMKTGKSRRVAYRLVGAAYDNKAKGEQKAATSNQNNHQTDKPTAVPRAQHVGGLATSPTWPPVVKCVLDDPQTALKDKLKAVAQIRYMEEQKSITESDRKAALKTIYNGMRGKYGVFAASIVTEAWHSSSDGMPEGGPENRIVQLSKDSLEQMPWIADHGAMGIVILDDGRRHVTTMERMRGIQAENEATLAAFKRIEDKAEQILLVSNKNGEPYRDRKNEWLVFDTIDGAFEYRQLTGSNEHLPVALMKKE